MFISANSSAFLQALETSRSLLSSDYSSAYHAGDHSVARSLTPAAFDRVLDRLIVLNRRNARVGGIAPIAPVPGDTIGLAAPIILAMIARWGAPLRDHASAWELAVAAAQIPDADDAAA